MQALANKAFLGNGLQAAAPAARCTRKATTVRAAAATALNTKRSEEVGLGWHVCTLTQRVLYTSFPAAHSPDLHSLYHLDSN